MTPRTSRGICMALFVAACFVVIYSALLRPIPMYTSSPFGVNFTPGTNFSSNRTGLAWPTAQDTGDVFSDPYAPPNNSTYSLSHGLPLPSVSTRRTGGAYTQVGVLVSGSGAESSTMILPLFGRQIDRSKFQYYALSNTGAVNTKLPVRISNRRCTAELGCDEISNGDKVFVEGYGDIFAATVYDSPQFMYSI